MVENRIEMQRLIDGIELYELVASLIYLLNEWGKLERKHSEGMSRMIRKLSASSKNVPPSHGAQVIYNYNWSDYIFFLHTHTNVYARGSPFFCHA